MTTFFFLQSIGTHVSFQGANLHSLANAGVDLEQGGSIRDDNFQGAAEIELKKADLYTDTYKNVYFHNN